MNYTINKEKLIDSRIDVIDSFTVGTRLVVLLYLKPKGKYTCAHCGSCNTILYGIKYKKIKIVLDDIYENDVSLKFHRIYCKDCLRIFNDETNLVSLNKNVSHRTTYKILSELKEDLTFTYIAKDNQVSIDTIIKIFEKYVPDKYYELPEVMCIDEFKNLKSAKGKYAFVIYDPVNQIVIDVLEDRRLDTLRKYFYNRSLSERENVKYIISDMNETYAYIAKMYFPFATYVVDCFHYLRYVEDAFNDVRIRVQSKFKTNTSEYKILKKNWKVLSSYIVDIEHGYGEIYNPIENSKTNIDDIINDSLFIDDELFYSYDMLQSFLKMAKRCKYEDIDTELDKWIETIKDTEIKEFNSLYKMFKSWKEPIKNSFIRFGDKRLSNGPMEGINNKIKSIKKISYGYNNFNHFKRRIKMIINRK